MDFLQNFVKARKDRGCFCCCAVYGGFGKWEEKGGFLSRENREWLKLDMW